MEQWLRAPQDIRRVPHASKPEPALRFHYPIARENLSCVGRPHRAHSTNRRHGGLTAGFWNLPTHLTPYMLAQASFCQTLKRSRRSSLRQSAAACMSSWPCVLEILASTHAQARSVALNLKPGTVHVASCPGSLSPVCHHDCEGLGD